MERNSHIINHTLRIFLIAMLLYTGTGSCVTGIGGIMLGEHDYDGVIRLIRSTTRTVINSAPLERSLDLVRAARRHDYRTDYRRVGIGLCI